MPVPGQREYLEAKVQTASAPQLHLMLIDGALRFGREAEKALIREDEEAALPLLQRTMKIVAELLAGVKKGESEVNQKLVQLYQFVYARLTSVYANQDHKLMADALQILEFEQQTWRLACEKVLQDQSTQGNTKAPKQKKPPMPHLGKTGAPQSGLSIEA